MEKNKNQRKINLSIKYELKPNSQNLRSKTIENTRKEKNKKERKIVSKSPNSLIKKAYIHSLLKSSSTSNLRESKPKFQEKIILGGILNLFLITFFLSKILLLTLLI